MNIFKKIGISFLFQIVTYLIHYILFPLIGVSPVLDVLFLVISSFILSLLWMRLWNIGIGYFLLSLPIYPVLIILNNPYAPDDSFGLGWGLEWVVPWCIVLVIQVVIFILWKIWIIAKKLHDDK
ncbi:MAG: hypothetical protein FWG70_07970 [Oscillospiraceae bacterium]|nr:hypothetical protein [Oscillospiraceae bacterium]